MCKKLFDFITTFFNKDQKEKSLLEVNTSIHSQDKVNSKSKRIKKGNDNSINVIGDDTKVDDHSTTVQCDQYNQQNYYLDNESSDLIVHARWLYNVPHEIKRVQNEIDSFNVLSPIDPNYIQPSLRVTLDDVDDKYHGVYFCITKNVAIKNLKLLSIELSLDTCQTSFNGNEDVFAIIDKSSSFVVYGKDYKEGNGNINVVFGFSKDKVDYKQRFCFTVMNNSNEFVQKKYEYPSRDIDNIVGIIL